MQVSTRAILPVLVRWFNPSILAAFSGVNERGNIGRGERLAGVPSCMTTQKGAGGVVGKSAAARRSRTKRRAVQPYQLADVVKTPLCAFPSSLACSRVVPCREVGLAF